MIILSEFLSTTFPRAYAILLGAVFLFVVYFLPHGIAGVMEPLWHRYKAWRTSPRGPTVNAEGAGQ